MIFVGVDWAEAHHDVHVEDGDGRRLGGGRLPEGVPGITRFHELVARHAEEPGEVVIGIETDRGLFVAALVAAGYLVYAVNPLSTSRYRDRHSVSGAKSDPGDAKVLADMVRTDRHNHRAAAGDSDAAGAVKALARAHQGMVWSRGRQVNRRCCVGRSLRITERSGGDDRPLDGHRELVECHMDSVAGGHIGGELVMAAA